MNKKSIQLVSIFILSVILLSAFVRIYGIDKESYWFDEIKSVQEAQVTFTESMYFLINSDTNLPLHITLLFGWVRIFGVSEFSTRMLSAIFGIASVYLIYLIGRKMFNAQVGLYAAILLALSKIAVYYSQENRPYSLFLFISLLSFYAYLLYEDKKTLKYGIFYFFSSLLMLYTHLFAFLVLFIQLMHYIIKNRDNIKHIINFIIIQLTLVISFLPWVPILLHQMKTNIGQIAWLAKPGLFQIIAVFYDISGNAALQIIFIILILMGISKLIKLKSKIGTDTLNNIYMILLWFFIPLILVFIFSQFNRPIFHTRYFLFIVPAVHLGVAYCIFLANKNKFFQYSSLVLIAGISIFLIIGQYNSIEKDDWRGISKFLKENVKQNDIVFIYPFYQEDPLTYYYTPDCFKEIYVHSCNFKKHGILSLNWLTESECCSDTSKLTATYGKNELGYYLDKNIWLVSVRPEVHYANNSLFNYFNNRKKITMSKDIGEIKIYKFE